MKISVVQSIMIYLITQIELVVIRKTWMFESQTLEAILKAKSLSKYIIVTCAVNKKHQNMRIQAKSLAEYIRT